jgi:hypothetical protein
MGRIPQSTLKFALFPKFHHPAPTPCKIAVFPGRTLALHDAQSIGQTDPANVRLAPSRCRPSYLDPYAADCIFRTWSIASSMLCSSKICLPSTPPPPAAPVAARRTSWFSSATPPRQTADRLANRLAPVPGHTAEPPR